VWEEEDKQAEERREKKKLPLSSSFKNTQNQRVLGSN
jgi:hypothetical protein